MGKALIPVAALGAKAAGSIAEGKATGAQADAQRKQALVNMFIGKTRAIQTDTEARENLTSELATLRATLAGNGQRLNVGTLAIADEFREAGERDRRVAVANANQETADQATSASNFGRSARDARRLGWIRGAQSLFSIGDYMKKGGA